MRTWAPAMPLMALGALVLAAHGCRREPTEPQVVEPPSFIRFAVPADSSEHIQGTIDVSITFRRPVPLGSARLDLFPAPLSHGEQVFSPTGRTLSWLNVRLDPDENVYRLLVDGVTMPAPEMIKFFPTTPPGITGRMGGCISLMEPGPDLSQTVVFALPPGDFDMSPGALPDFFRQVHPIAASLIYGVPSVCDDLYFLTYLEVQPLEVIGVIDTNGDGTYDLYDDWWGAVGGKPTDDPLVDPFGFNLAIGPPVRASASRQR